MNLWRSLRRRGQSVWLDNFERSWITNSTDDIGDEAAKYLLDETWAGQWTRNLMEPQNLTLMEITALLSRMLDYPINYVQITIESIQHQLALAGATPKVQKELGDLLRALGNPDGIYATARTPDSITPTTFEQFAAYKLLPKFA